MLSWRQSERYNCLLVNNVYDGLAPRVLETGQLVSPTTLLYTARLCPVTSTGGPDGQLGWSYVFEQINGGIVDYVGQIYDV